ncbi:CYTH and CHAD domain-containing protein [Kitasatospora sp. NPDC001527]|uniref:CYTH and CHAD domain-containing protein n=1 Tax=Kitasatospora sp. NPDC001527 TaxID=3154519 RepID=UPI0033225B0D
MATTHVETERKYDGPALPERLDRAPGVAAVERGERQDLDAVYYDTPDLRLLRRRITLRRRSGGGDAGWHLKLPMDADARREVALPLEAAGPDGVPQELALLVAAYARGAGLGPVAHLCTHRAETVLRDDRGEALARITEDRVTARVCTDGPPGAAGDGAGPDAEPIGWTEFEVELDHGPAALLDALDEVLTDAGLVRSPWPSKLARVLGGEPAPTAPAEPGPPGSAGAVVTAGLRARVGELLVLDAAVRRGEPDSVHRMRVTARRLRSLLRAHRRLFDRRRTQALSDGLRWLGRLLGRARDQEVLGELLVEHLDAVPARLRGAALRGRLTERYARGYRAAWREAVSGLDGARYHALLDELDAFAARPPLRRRAGRDARAYLAATLRREQRRTTKRLDRALRAEPGPPRDRALHRARKAAKRARYTAEDTRTGVRRRAAKRAETFAARMKRLHKVLGAHQDSVVARQELAVLAEDPAGRADGFALGVLHERQRQAAAVAAARLPELRRRAGRRKLSRPA